MTIRKYGIDEIGKREDVNVWFCESCDSYHIKAGNTVLTFNKQEFSDFVNETWNCYYDQEENVLALQ